MRRHVHHGVERSEFSKFFCFTTEGSHCRLKLMSRNSSGLSLLRNRFGVHLVVDNHTIDDNLRHEGWYVTKRSMRGPYLMFFRFCKRIAIKPIL